MITVHILIPFNQFAAVILAVFGAVALFKIVSSLMSLKFW